MEEKAVRKTTAKRAVRRTTTKVASARTTAAKTKTASARKAPVRASAPVATKKKPSKKLIIGSLFFIAVVGASIGIGYSDKGAIDVSSAIATRKQNATPEEQERFKAVPVQQSQNNVVNGGLIGSGKKTPPPAPVETVATTTATSSEETASSSEPIETGVDAEAAALEDESAAEVQADGSEEAVAQ